MIEVAEMKKGLSAGASTLSCVSNYTSQSASLSTRENSVARASFLCQNITCLVNMILNSIYKNGQVSMIYFALGLDGTEPYSAPFPDSIYAGLRINDEGN